MISRGMSFKNSFLLLNLRLDIVSTYSSIGQVSGLVLSHLAHGLVESAQENGGELRAEVRLLLRLFKLALSNSINFLRSLSMDAFNGVLEELLADIRELPVHLVEILKREGQEVAVFLGLHGKLANERHSLALLDLAFFLHSLEVVFVIAQIDMAEVVALTNVDVDLVAVAREDIAGGTSHHKVDYRRAS
jgi:hypothetical protein